MSDISTMENMSPKNSKMFEVTLSDFINVLGEEFLSATGYGVYAHLSFSDINQLFAQYQEQSVSVREFARQYIRTH